MLSFLDQALSLPAVIWLFVAVFLVHDAEEIATAGWWVNTRRTRLEALAQRFRFARLVLRTISQTSSQFAGAVFVILLAVLLGSYTGARSAASGQGVPGPYLAMLGILFLHVFTHVGQAILFRGYAPGVVTAVLLALPYSLYAFHRVLAADLATWGGIVTASAVGIALVLPAVLLAHVAGRWLAGR
mgnify:CR=1 FL=1